MITFENAQKCHRRMWGWLAETGEREKSDWPEFHEANSHGKIIQRPLVSCFCCEMTQFECERCPIKWAKAWYRCSPCETRTSPYQKWKDAYTIKARKKYAAIIRDLPWERK